MAAQESVSFGSMVRRRRRALGLTQAELAERAGLSDRAIRELERGAKHVPRKQTVQLLADALESSGTERETFQRVGRQVRHSLTPRTCPKLAFCGMTHQ